MHRQNLVCCFVLGVLFWSSISVNGHGRLMEPAARSSLWRFQEYQQYYPPINYNDNELNCGGFSVQYNQNGGRCGECGDAYHIPRPRDHEEGGKYSQGIIARNYTVDFIDVFVQLTANHLGYFEFRLCAKNDPFTPVTQSCFDENLLLLENGETKYHVKRNVNEYRYRLKIPVNVKCTHCVLQWNYRAGNNWGACSDGSGAVGCGPQETFRGCSDISIS